MPKFNQMKKTIALTWGGTGWHIFPLLSVYNYFKDEQDYQFIWVWEEGSLEEEVATKNKIPFLWVSAWKIRRYLDIRNLYEPLKNLTGIAECIYYIKKHNIDVVFSKWGYVSIPLCIAAKILWKKVLIHESDTVTWISNKIISKFADTIFYTFPNNKIDDVKHVHSGQIMNPELIDYLETLEIEENEKLNVIVSCWSQWSQRVFEALLKIIGDLQDIDFHIILWEKNMHFRDDFKQYPNTKVHDFITQKRLWKILKDMDIAITRGWATTLWEMYAFWIHTIIIPLKSSAGRHQEKNALYFQENFWSNVLDEDKNLEEDLYNLLKKYKNLRKWWLNLDNFFEALTKIKEYL